MATPGRRSADEVTQEVLDHAAGMGLEMGWERLEALEPQCGFGQLGICCRNCAMGPCRIDPFGGGATRGACGADADTIVARNLLRKTCAGAAAHSDHGRDITHALQLAAEGKSDAYQIKNVPKLLKLAAELGIEADGKEPGAVAWDVVHEIFREFGRQEGEVRIAYRAPEAQQKMWRQHGVMPGGIDREVVSGMHRTHVGVDNEYAHLLLGAVKVALSDGWGGSMAATDLSDVLFGAPEPLRATANLGILEKDCVNLIVHGHEPTLSEVVVQASRDPELVALAKEKGAKGIIIGGICCTANEILMRHGIPLVGNFLQQEPAITTGVVDLMLVDVQCIMPAVGELAEHFTTTVLSTSPKARFPRVEHLQFEEAKALEIAKEIVRRAIENFPKRAGAETFVPEGKTDLIAGFTAENVFEFLGGRYRPTYRPLNDAIIAGRIRGVAGVVGCNNLKQVHDESHIAMVKHLIKNDVLVLQTGCSAIACGKEGLLQPEAAYELAGPGLREVCETVGLPPVLHVGSCVDNSRILMAATEMVKEGGLGDDLSQLPVAGAAPEWMSEKAISIGMYFAASGVFTVMGLPFPVLGSEKVTKWLCEDMEALFGGKFAFEIDPIKGAELMIAHINKKREALKLKPMMYERVTIEAAVAAS